MFWVLNENTNSENQNKKQQEENHEDVSNKYVVRIDPAECTIVANRLDIIKVWAIDHFYACSNPSCGLDSYAVAATRIERICDH